MKKSLIVLFVALLALGGNAMAQKNQKFGHINSSDLMQIMPGRDTAQAVLQKEAAELEQRLTTMQNELKQRYNTYQEKQSEWSEIIRQSEQKTIQDLGSRIEEFQQEAQQKMQVRQEALLKPIVDRAKKAIADVAKENGYTYVFDSSVGVLLYQPESDDIMPLVKKKLELN